VRTSLFLAAAVVLTTVPATAQTSGLQDPLLDRLIGDWVLEGTIAGEHTTHDVVFEWVLEHQFLWLRREAPGFRVYFVPGSYALAHQDSLLARLPAALTNARRLIDAPDLAGPVDVFFIENRAQMKALTGMSATGFAEASSRTVLLVTHSEWRSFERHEIMHVVAGQTWGPPGPDTAWLQEGLAQAADGRCAGYPNADMMMALAERHGWIPLGVMLTQFRQQPDLRAYLQAAVFVDYLLERFGLEPLRDFWRSGASPESRINGRTLAAIERDWKGQLRAGPVDPISLASVESRGCG
jgi:hypothetical protein